jgi:hypothetical protein
MEDGLFLESIGLPHSSNEKQAAGHVSYHWVYQG